MEEEKEAKRPKVEVTPIKPFSRTIGGGVTKALKSVAGERSLLQQVWLESGVFCVGGVDSWHPESPCVSICAVVTAGKPDMHEICNKSAAIAANAATLTVNWAIE